MAITWRQLFIKSDELKPLTKIISSVSNEYDYHSLVPKGIMTNYNPDLNKAPYQASSWQDFEVTRFESREEAEHMRDQRLWQRQLQKFSAKEVSES